MKGRLQLTEGEQHVPVIPRWVKSRTRGGNCVLISQDCSWVPTADPRTILLLFTVNTGLPSGGTSNCTLMFLESMDSTLEGRKFCRESIHVGSCQKT